MYNEIIEALLYVQGQKGLTPSALKAAIDVPTPNARKLLKEFSKNWNKESHGLQIIEFNDTFKFATLPELKEQIQRVIIQERKQRLSQAAIETAGIIAYKQPMTKSQVNQIRGVSSEAVVNTLLVKGLIEEKGIATTPGSPILYGITEKFYDYFKIKSLKELPQLSEFNESEGIEDFDLYASQREEEN